MSALDRQRAEYPHCDPNVLHAPGVCVYCDDYPDRQDLRRLFDEQFSAPEANGWSGNVAVRAGETMTHMGATYVVGEPITSSPTVSEGPLSRALRRLWELGKAR